MKTLFAVLLMVVSISTFANCEVVGGTLYRDDGTPYETFARILDADDMGKCLEKALDILNKPLIIEGESLRVRFVKYKFYGHKQHSEGILHNRF